MWGKAAVFICTSSRLTAAQRPGHPLTDRVLQSNVPSGVSPSLGLAICQMQAQQFLCQMCLAGKKRFEASVGSPPLGLTLA